MAAGLFTQSDSDPPPCVEPAAGSYFVATYPPFSTWTAERTPDVLGYLQSPPEPKAEAPLGLYVHIPFCARRCDYCFYLSHADKPGEAIDEYIEGVVRELGLYRGAPALANRRLSFVYFGGGTPSLLSERQLDRLMTGLQSLFPWASAREVTFECAPKSATESKLRLLRRFGVTRVSLGIQQLDDDVLRESGRVHSVADVQRAYEAIQRVGFSVVNVDLIVGLVGQTDESFLAGLDTVIGMKPDCVTIYQLVIPHNTPLFRQMQSSALQTLPAAGSVKRTRLAAGFDRLEQAGYTIRSAYAAVKDPQRHRFVYQDALYTGADLLGIGESAFSYLDGLHFQNLCTFQSYLSCTASGRLPLHRAYALDDDERLVREFILRLKLGRADAADFRRKFGVDITERFSRQLNALREQGFLECDLRGVSVTREGLLAVDRFVAAFYLPRHQNVPYT